MVQETSASLLGLTCKIVFEKGRHHSSNLIFVFQIDKISSGFLALILHGHLLVELIFILFPRRFVFDIMVFVSLSLRSDV